MFQLTNLAPRCTALLAVFLCVSCETPPARNVKKQGCDLPAGAILARDETAAYDGVAAVRDPSIGGGARIVWSSRAGTFTRTVDSSGVPGRPAVKITDRCRGGIDLLARKGGFRVGCVRPDSGAFVYSLDTQGKLLRHEYLGRAGRDSRGIRLVAHGTRWTVSWHDGTPAAYAAMLVEVGPEGPAPAQHLSDPRYASDAATMTAVGEDWIAAWPETRFGTKGGSRTRLMVKRRGKPSSELGDMALAQSDPQLAHGPDGTWLGFRSLDKDDRQPQLYAVRLTDRLRMNGKPRRVGRANTLGTPVVMECPTGAGGDANASRRFAITPRMYGGERYVALHPLDKGLSGLGGGNQYYANSLDYVGAAGVCTDRGMLLLAAERTPLPSDRARLMVAPATCR